MYPRRWACLAVLALSLVIISLDGTVLNVALPSMQRALDASSRQLAWITDAYPLVFAALVLVAGSLGDRYGRKGCLQVGLSMLAAGSVLAVLSDTSAAVIVARAVMGIGGAFIMPATLSITTAIFTGGERSKAIAAWAACAGIGVALGPVVGGWLVERYWWGSVFVVNVPIVLVAVTAGAVLLPRSKDPAAGRPDYAGAALSTVAITALVYGVITAPDVGWRAASVTTALAAGTVALAGFIVAERRSSAPMLQLTHFRNPRFSAACAAVALTFFALLGSMYLLTQYLQIVRGYTSLQAGIRILPLPLGLGIAASRSATLANRFGTKGVVAGGMATTASGLALLASTLQQSGYWLLGLSLGIVGVGMGAAMAPSTDAIMGAVPVEQAGVASAVNDAVRQFGGTLGIAVLGSALTARYRALLDPVIQRLGGGPYRSALDSVGAAHATAHAAHDASLLHATDRAFVSAMGFTVWGAALSIGLGAVLVGVLLPARQRVRRALARHSLPRRAGYAPRHSADPVESRPWIVVADLSRRLTLSEYN